MTASGDDATWVDTYADPQTEVVPAPIAAERYVQARRLDVSGEVFEALDVRMNRQVVVKRLGAVDGASEAFLREALAIARVSHPNVVRVYDADVADGRASVVMERARGVTLQRWAGQRPRSWREVCAVHLDVARGLAAVHDEGLVHRDVTPSNIAIGPSGSVKLLDFGLTRVRDDTELPTLRNPLEFPGGDTQDSVRSTVALTETAAFTAPEQQAGDPVGPEADVFSLCASILGTLEGADPFDATDPDTGLRAKLAGPPAMPPSLPGALRALLRRGLEPDPRRRLSSAREVAVALERLLAARPRRRRVVVGGAIIAAICAVGWTLGAADRDGACVGLEGPVGWGPLERQALTQRFAQSEHDYAPELLPRVLDALDAYGRAWREAAVEACETTAIRAEASGRVLELRRGCLQDASDDLSRRVGLLANSEADLGHALPIATGVAAVTRCSDLGELERREASRGSAAQARALLGAAAWLDAGRPTHALAHVQPVLEETLPDSVRARALLLRGRAALESDAPADAIVDLEAAFALALPRDEDRVALDSALALLRARCALGDVAAGEAVATIARGLALGLDDDAALVQGLVGRACLANAKHDVEGALALLDDARARQVETSGPGSLTQARILEIQAAYLLDSGRRARAAEPLRQAEEILEDRLGPHHPDTERVRASLDTAR